MYGSPPLIQLRPKVQSISVSAFELVLGQNVVDKMSPGKFREQHFWENSVN